MRKVQCVIIGGGSAGLAAAVELKKNGIDDLLILEKGPEPGGAEADLSAADHSEGLAVQFNAFHGVFGDYRTYDNVLCCSFHYA